jgi:deferrochelatase/peroxidase EfeB
MRKRSHATGEAKPEAANGEGAQTTLCPAGRGTALGRRQLLLGLGTAGGTAIMGGLVAGAAAQDSSSPLGKQDDADLRSAVPYHGIHQAGIVTPRPQFGLAVAFDVLAASRAQLQGMFQALTQRSVFLTGGGPTPSFDPKFPPPDSGLLGLVVLPGNLTMTVALGASLFDERFGLAAQKPKHLRRMMSFPNDALDPDQCHGDLLVQFCSDSAEVNIHALRDVIKNTPGQLAVRWKQDGFLPGAAQRKETERNLLGFKDGTANPSSADAALMDRLVWVRPGMGEPDWAVGGSYQVVRTVRTFVERWDRTPLEEQQNIIGREKATGAPLGMAAEKDLPDYSGDPEGKRMPLDAHIRLANPRTPASAANLILRRPFNYSRGVTRAGQLDMGLLFICFQADLEKGFLAVQERLNGEPLEEYIKPIGGGFFFALPGVPSSEEYLAQNLVTIA